MLEGNTYDDIGVFHQEINGMLETTGNMKRYPSLFLLLSFLFLFFFSVLGGDKPLLKSRIYFML